MDVPADLVAWLHVHDALHEGLRHVRRLAPERDADRLAEALAAFGRRLRLHVRQEEDVLLPVYAPLAEALPPNAAPDVLRDDHRRLLAHLDAAAASLVQDAPERILALAESLCLLQGVLEHHDVRERRWFKPTLDAHVDAATRHGWLARFAAEEHALPPDPPPALRPAPPPLPWSPPPSPSEAVDALRLAVAQDAVDDRALQILDVLLGRMTRPGDRKARRQLEVVSGLIRALPAELDVRRDRLAEAQDRLRLLAILVR